MCIVVRQFVVLAGLLALPVTSSVAAIIITGSTFPAHVAGDEDAVAVTGVTVGGNFSAAGDGTLAIGDGTTLNVNTNPYVNIAPLSGSNGSITVTGASSTLRVEGADGSDPANGAFLTIGRGGTGTLTVEAGAKVEIDSLGTPLARGETQLGYPAGLNVARNAGSVGIVNLTDTNSELRVTSDFAVGHIGREGTGLMNVTNGASLVFEGINSDLNVSSDLFSAPTGARHGTLNVLSGGSVSGMVFLNVGGSVGGMGLVNVDGSTSSISLAGACTPDCPVGYSFPNQGAFLTIGANQGTGVVNISNGARLNVDSSGVNGGFALGGSSILGPLGHGTLNISGPDSELRVTGNRNLFVVGRLEGGAGVLNITDGGRVVVENLDGLSRGFVGDRPGATGAINVVGSTSLLDAGHFLGVGVDSQDRSDAGTAVVALVDGGTVRADLIQVAAGGVVKGNGTLDVAENARIDPHGRIEPGLSIGEIVITGDLILAGGTMLLEADSLFAVDRIHVMGSLILLDGFIDILLGYVPESEDVLEFFNVGGAIEIADTFGGFRAFAATGTAVPLGTSFNVAVGDFRFSPVVASVPEPGSLLLILFGLAVLALCGRHSALPRETPAFRAV